MAEIRKKQKFSTSGTEGGNITSPEGVQKADVSEQRHPQVYSSNLRYTSLLFLPE